MSRNLRWGTFLRMPFTSLAVAASTIRPGSRIRLQLNSLLKVVRLLDLLFIDFLGEDFDAFLYVLTWFSWRFIVEQLLTLNKFLNGFFRNAPLFFLALDQIQLISNQHYHYARFRLVMNFFQPFLGVVVGLHVSQIVEKEGTHCFAVLRCCDGLVLLWPGCVPHLQLHNFLIRQQQLLADVFADDRRRLVLMENIFCVPDQKARLSHCRIANEHDLEQFLVALFRQFHLAWLSAEAQKYF